jgi:hypothetical protein
MSKSKTKPNYLNYHQQQTVLFVAPSKKDVTRLEYELMLRKGCRPCENITILSSEAEPPRYRPWSLARWTFELMTRASRAVARREYNPKSESYGLVLGMDKLLSHMTSKCRRSNIENLLEAMGMMQDEGMRLCCVLPFEWLDEHTMWRLRPTEFFYPSGVLHTAKGALDGPYPRVGPDLVWVDEHNRVVDQDSPAPRKEELPLVWEKSLK